MQYCVGFEKNGFEWDEKEVNFQAWLIVEYIKTNKVMEFRKEIELNLVENEKLQPSCQGWPRPTWCDCCR